MLPDLFRFGPFQLHTYGLMITIAFAAAIFISIHRGKKVGIDPGRIWDLALIVLFTSLVGARLTYVFTHVEEFKGNWFAVINPIQPDGRIGIAGMVLLGGVVAATIASIWYLRRKKLPIWKFADVIAPSLALGIGIGRIGCFSNGCCFGMPTDSWLGVVFPKGSVAGSFFPNTPVLPTQLFSIAWGIILFASLWFAERWKKFDGFTFSLFLIGYSIFRIVVDTVRYYEEGDILIHTETLCITFSQAVSAGLIAFGVVLFLTQRRKNRAN
jgi:phosphatidylglycerol:prolipoprotein diacylglycerol transferase